MALPILAPPGAEQLFLPYLPIPVLEAAVGQTFSLHETRPIGKEGIDPALSGRGESPLTDALAFGRVSPADIKYVGEAYFGAVYTLADATAKLAALTFGTKTAREDLRDITERVPFINGVVTNPDKLDVNSGYAFAEKAIEARNSLRYAKKHGIPLSEEERKDLKSEARYAKQAERIKKSIGTLNTAKDKLKNSTNYKDAAEAQRKFEALQERTKKKLGRLEGLREKSEE